MIVENVSYLNSQFWYTPRIRTCRASYAAKVTKKIAALYRQGHFPALKSAITLAYMYMYV